MRPSNLVKTGLPIRPFLLGMIVAGILGAIVVPPLILVHRDDLPGERGFGAMAVSLVAKVGAGSATNPLGANVRSTDAARAAFTGSCATCHGAKGDGKGVFGQDTYPEASDLTAAAAKNKSDGELFWITKNGLAFTAMPAFGKQYTDPDLWALVVYIRALQRGQVEPLSMPAPTAADLAFANPFGNSEQRGAAEYFAAGCADCHGPVGYAPNELALHGRMEGSAVRGGGIGMPKYGVERISEAALTDLIAYVNSFDQGRGVGR